MLFSPEIETMKGQITAIVVRDSEGFFDGPKESEDLQITVRVACEFSIFLQQSNDVPELGEAEYMAGTMVIRLSGRLSDMKTTTKKTSCSTTISKSAPSLLIWSITNVHFSRQSNL